VIGEGDAAMDMQELYNRVKKHPDAIVRDVGESHPIIISETDMVLTYKDGSQGHKTVYTTFEYVKKHLKELKACPCEACQAAIASYRHNKKVIRALKRGATPEDVPDGWIREIAH
jgi:hypothetical protein